MMKKFKKWISLVLTLGMLCTILSSVPVSQEGVVNVAAATDTSVKNLAFRRAAYQSSAYSVNETAQLVTDGIIGDNADEAQMAYTFEHQHGNESRFGNVKNLFDQDPTTDWETYQKEAWVQVRLPRKVKVDTYTLTSGNADWSKTVYAESWTLQGSNDGVHFTTIDTQTGETFADNHTTNTYRIKGSSPETYSWFRLNMKAKSDRIYMGGWGLYDAEGNSILAPYSENVLAFHSAWMSGGTDEEWVYVDLGEGSTFSSAKVYWGSMYADSYEIQISDDAEHWTTAAEKTDGAGGVEELTFPAQTARYVRLLCKTTAPENLAYIVRELEVYGTNGRDDTGQAGQMPAPEADGTQVLSGGNWKLVRALETDPITDKAANPEAADDQADALGCTMSTAGYDDSDWLPAVVPGTVLTSYQEAGALADPDFGDQQLCISDSYFKSNFWYRNHFTIPQEQSGQKVWLNFEAINWKAEVYFNGSRLGNIRGAFTRAKFDVTEYVNFGGENYLAVLIYKHTDPGTAYISNDDHPGTMGGVFGNDGSIGRDAPTYNAALGWDWVPTVRDRAIGIYNDVFLSYSGQLQVIDPWMVTTFDRGPDGQMDLTKANLTLKTEVRNTGDTDADVTVSGTVDGHPDLTFEKQLAVPAGQTIQVEFEPVKLENPNVWWPNTYGSQPLYTAAVTASNAGAASDTKKFQFGVREMTFPLDESSIQDPNGFRDGENLAICCNGVRIVLRGGNWGLEDKNLAVDEEEYDEKIRFHKEANFNMIRNWGGQTNDPALYEACDKYGILIWDDFFFPGCWSQSPSDHQMFIDNAIDKIKNYRSHPSLAMYCGANEMYPEVFEIEVALRALTCGMRELITHDDYAQYNGSEDPEEITGYPCLDGTRHYIPNSGDYPTAVDGPHQAKPPKFYFNNTYANQVTSERGLPNIPVVESMRRIFPEENLWPRNDMWALHDFAQGWNTNGKQYMEDLNHYGSYDSLDGFVSRAQMQGYEIHKALFEGAVASRSNGILMWMSNPAWPSLMWQAYDYFQDVNGGYFGLKTGCQPINLIWNPVNNSMVLSNLTPNEEELTATAEIYDISGRLLYAHSVTRSMPADSTKDVFQLQFPGGGSSLQFIQTRVENAQGEVVGRDFYWNNIDNYQDYTALASLPQAELSASYDLMGTDGAGDTQSQHYRICVENTGETPALQIRLKVLNQDTGERVLPVFYEDNYFALMPGESREINLDFKTKDLNGGPAQFLLEGWNASPSELEEGSKDYYVGNAKLYHGEAATGTIEPGPYTSSVEITAKQDAAVNVTSMLGLYRVSEDGETMIDSSVQTCTDELKAGETRKLVTGQVQMPETDDLEQYVFKTFVWDTVTGMHPLKQSAAFQWSPVHPPTYLPRNIATGAAVTADNSDSSKPAQNVTDGDYSTRWASGDENDRHWLMVDLGDVKTVSAVRIAWESAFGKQYTIDGSADGTNFTRLAQQTNGTGGNDLFEFDATDLRYVRINMTERGTGWGYSIYEVEVCTNFIPSVALGATVTASAYDRGASLFTPEKVIDGDLDSRWATMEEKDSQWLMVDMHEPKTFSSIDLVWEAAFGKAYTIEVSNDGTNFTPIVTQTSGTGGTDRYQIDPVTARYVKINMTRRGTGWGYSIWEFSLYE